MILNENQKRTIQDGKDIHGFDDKLVDKMWDLDFNILNVRYICGSTSTLFWSIEHELNLLIPQ